MLQGICALSLTCQHYVTRVQSLEKSCNNLGHFSFNKNFIYIFCNSRRDKKIVTFCIQQQASIQSSAPGMRKSFAFYSITQQVLTRAAIKKKKLNKSLWCFRVCLCIFFLTAHVHTCPPEFLFFFSKSSASLFGKK